MPVPIRSPSRPRPRHPSFTTPQLHTHVPHQLPRPSPCPAPHGPCQAPARGPLPVHRTYLPFLVPGAPPRAILLGETAVPPLRQVSTSLCSGTRTCGWMSTDRPASALPGPSLPAARGLAAPLPPSPRGSGLAPSPAAPTADRRTDRRGTWMCARALRAARLAVCRSQRAPGWGCPDTVPLSGGLTYRGNPRRPSSGPQPACRSL